MDELVARLRSDLTLAMKARNTAEVRVLRVVLAAIGNAEAQPAAETAPTSSLSSGPIAGAAAGHGAAEVDRRGLTESDVLGILRTEIEERPDEAAFLARYL